MTDRRDIAAAIDGAAAARSAGDEQLDWLPPIRDALNDTRRAAIADGVRRRGRPPGAQNIAKREALEFVRRVFGDPLIERSRWLLLSPEELASALGCTTAEAFDRQDAIRADLARFFYAPLAPVDGAGNTVVPSFHMTVGSAGRVLRPDARPWDYLDGSPAETQQNQALPQPAEPVSHGPVSHEDGK